MVSGRLDAYAHELAYSKLKIQVLEERLRLQRIEKYGRSSEKLSSLQLELLEQEPGVSREEVVAESRRPSPPPASERKKRLHPGRQALPAHLPRVERVIACTPEQCVCGNCGRDTTLIGYEVSEVLNVEPERVSVQSFSHFAFFLVRKVVVFVVAFALVMSGAGAKPYAMATISASRFICR